MPRYTIVLIPRNGDKPGASGTTNRQERQFANLGEALRTGREMYHWHARETAGFRIYNAAGEIVHE